MTGGDPLVQHWAALEADLAARYHIGPEQIRCMSWRHLSILVDALWGWEGSLWVGLQTRADTNTGGWSPGPGPTVAADTATGVEVLRQAFAGARKVKRR